MEVPEACRECIIRDVMMVDQIEYDEVSLRLFKFAEQKMCTDLSLAIW